MKKSQKSKRGKTYLRIVHKHWRKHGFPSSSQQAEAKVKVDEMIADLKAKAAALPALKKEQKRLERELWKHKLGIAKLAALIHPELCEKKPIEAVKLAIRLLRAVDEAGPIIDAEDRDAKARAKKDELLGINAKYSVGVKVITEQERPGRAREYFELFLLVKHKTKKLAVAASRHYESRGFTGMEVKQLREEFRAWWPFRGHKGKQGRVKNPEKDNRKKPKLAPLPKGVRERLGRFDHESGWLFFGRRNRQAV